MKTARTLLVFFVMVFLVAGTALAAAPRFTPVEGHLVKKVDGFDFFVDYSGSMMMTHKQLKAEKVTLGKRILDDINALLPGLDYRAGLYSFAPYKAMLPHGHWDRAVMAKGIGQIRADQEIFGRSTDLGDGLIDHGPTIAGMQGRKALIIVSDGEVNRGPNPVIEARKLLQANPELCLHVISLADSEQGQAMLDAITRLKGCSVAAKAGDLLSDEAALRQFVNDVFYEEQMEEVIVLRGVHFAFDSDQLDATAQGILKEIAAVITHRPGVKVLLNGYTDWFGTDAYNKALSQRRADAVKKFLVARGISANRLIAQGKGKSFTYDNNTEEGCYMNRRVEIVFVD